MDTYNIYDVFTPTTTAKINYIERKSLDKRIDRALNTNGTQLIIYGHSGSGKTTLIENKLSKKYPKKIVTNCMSGMTFENVLQDAFNELNVYYVESEDLKEKTSKKAGIKALFIALNGQEELEKGSKLVRVLPPQITAQNLAKLMGEAGCCWILEDFHKLERSEKIKLSQCMKVFMDLSAKYNDLKIIFIGATETAREVVQLDKEMKRRVAEIHIPLMSEIEIRTIMERGFSLLNVKIRNEAIFYDLYDYCCGLPAICHKLCLLICDSLDIESTIESEYLVQPIDIKDDFEEYDSLDNNELKHQIDISPLTELPSANFKSLKNKSHQDNHTNTEKELSVLPKEIKKSLGEKLYNDKNEEMDANNIFVDFDNLKYALKEYIEDEKDSLKSSFEIAFQEKYAQDVIEAICDCERNGGSVNEIIENAKDINAAIKDEKIKELLNKFCTEEFNSLLIHSSDSGMYRFSDPFHKVFYTAYFNQLSGYKNKSHSELMKIFNLTFASVKSDIES